MASDQLTPKAIDWLLERESPGVRYLALRDLCGLQPDDRELIKARQTAHQEGPIASLLAAMAPEGYWEVPGPGYNPKYRSTVWILIMLAQLGASIDQDRRIARACEYVLDHALAPLGQFTTTGAPSGTADCLQGELCGALLVLGCKDARLDQAFEWMARSVTGEGVAPQAERDAPLRYYAGKCGPVFSCGSNNKLPCAWGAVKVMLALGELPNRKRTPLIRRAIKRGVDFLFSVDLVQATYPTGYSNKPSTNWWKFGFPVFYVTDLLQNAQALVSLGYAHDSRLAGAIEFIKSKRDPEGRWWLEYDYSGKTPIDWGKKRVPNKWVTLRALSVLQAVGG